MLDVSSYKHEEFKSPSWWPENAVDTETLPSLASTTEQMKSSQQMAPNKKANVKAEAISDDRKYKIRLSLWYPFIYDQERV